MVQNEGFTVFHRKYQKYNASSMTSQDLTFPWTILQTITNWSDKVTDREHLSLNLLATFLSSFLSTRYIRFVHPLHRVQFFLILFPLSHFPVLLLTRSFFVTDRHMKNRFTDRYAFGSERPQLRNDCYGAASAHPPRNRKPRRTHNETMRLLRARKERRGAPCPRKIPFRSFASTSVKLLTILPIFSIYGNF